MVDDCALMVPKLLRPAGGELSRLKVSAHHNGGVIVALSTNPKTDGEQYYPMAYHVCILASLQKCHQLCGMMWATAADPYWFLVGFSLDPRWTSKELHI